MGVTITRRGPKYVTLKKFCELTGDTPEAVRARRKKGIWQDGNQSIIAPDGKIRVNMDAVDKWVEGK